VPCLRELRCVCIVTACFCGRLTLPTVCSISALCYQDAAVQQEQQRCVIQDKLATLREDVDGAARAATAHIDALRQCSSNPGANYYWIVFVVLYGSVYFLQ
jgi:hypothetical protein